MQSVAGLLSRITAPTRRASVTLAAVVVVALLVVPGIGATGSSLSRSLSLASSPAGGGGAVPYAVSHPGNGSSGPNEILTATNGSMSLQVALFYNSSVGSFVATAVVQFSGGPGPWDVYTYFGVGGGQYATTNTSAHAIPFTQTYTTGGTYTFHADIASYPDYVAASTTIVVPLAGPSLGWANITQSGAPSGRAGAALAYDPILGGDLLFGGCVSGDYGGVNCAPTNDTWLLTNGTWTQLNPTASPPSRMRPAMVWDSADGYLLLFGGYVGATGSTPVGDTWEFNGTNWLNLTGSVGTAPSPRAGPAMIFATGWNRVVLFGGLTDLATETLVNDTWTYHNGSWTSLSTGASPAPRYDASFTWDPTINEAVLFAGYGGLYSGSLGDTWLFNGSAWTEQFPGVTPWNRNGQATAYDPTTNATVIFGGHASFVFYDDAWTYRAGVWALITSNSSPSTRWGSAMTFDPRMDTVVLFGGAVLLGSYEYFSDTWTLGLPRSNTSGGGTGPCAQTGGFGQGNSTLAIEVAYCLSSLTVPSTYSAQVTINGSVAPHAYQLWIGWGDGTLLNGTFNVSGNSVSVNASHLYTANGTYTVWFAATDATGNSVNAWMNLTFGSGGTGGSGGPPPPPIPIAWSNQTAGASPTARAGAAMAYDPATQSVILFGGCVGGDYWQLTCTPTNDTWSFAGGLWTQLFPAISPPARMRPAMVWDARDNYLLLFGGFTAGSGSQPLGDTWAFNGTAWLNLTPVAGSGPSPRAGPALVFAAGWNEVILFGGLTSLPNQTLVGDTWAFYNSSWHSLSTNAPPPGRYDASMAWDSAMGVIVLFGGYAGTTLWSLGDTWTFNGYKWTPQYPGTSP
jgi:hypothetical protein